MLDVSLLAGARPVSTWPSGMRWPRSNAYRCSGGRRIEAAPGLLGPGQRQAAHANGHSDLDTAIASGKADLYPEMKALAG